MRRTGVTFYLAYTRRGFIGTGAGLALVGVVALTPVVKLLHHVFRVLAVLFGYFPEDLRLILICSTSLEGLKLQV